MKKFRPLFILLLTAVACTSTGQATIVPTNTPHIAGNDDPYTVTINLDDFVTTIDNPYSPRIPDAPLRLTKARPRMVWNVSKSKSSPKRVK